MLNAAIKDAGGKVSDKKVLADALKKASFDSVRGGKLKLNNNNIPIQNFYLLETVKRADGSVSGGFSRAYLHHLDRCGEMLGPMLATIHNLHYYLNLMREVREALEQGRYAEFRRQFAQDRVRGV